ncbi:MAG TPA: nuclear transport factor 2 family protein [Cyclobacteriaceae bacterium]
MKRAIGILLIIVLFQTCGTKEQKFHEKNEIDAAMREYDRLLQTMDAEAIASIYDEQGDLGDQAHGREAIRKFLSEFKNVDVIMQASTTDAIDMLGDSAVQTGSYVQIDVVEKKDTVTVRGAYKVLWKWDGDEWKIKRMETQPL